MTILEGKRMFGKDKRVEPPVKRQVCRANMVELLKGTFETSDMKYDSENDDERSIFKLEFMGDDLPIAMSIIVDEKIIRFMYDLDIVTKTENYEKITWQLNIINRRLSFGAFFLNPDDGTISLQYSFPYLEANLSSDFLLSFIKMLVDTVDTYDGELKSMAE